MSGATAVHTQGPPAGFHRRPVRGLVLEAPHVFVEDVTIRGIERARAEYDAEQPEIVLAAMAGCIAGLGSNP